MTFIKCLLQAARTECPAHGVTTAAPTAQKHSLEFKSFCLLKNVFHIVVIRLAHFTEN